MNDTHDPQAVRDAARKSVLATLRNSAANTSSNAAMYRKDLPGNPLAEARAVKSDEMSRLWTYLADYAEVAFNIIASSQSAEQTQDERDAEPRIVCLCGSTKFRAEFNATNRELTLAGRIVLAPGVFSHADGIEISEAEKAALDKLHFAKIDLADEVFVVNPGGYIGTSTANEIAYATKTGKPVRYLAALEARDAKEA